MKTAIGRQQNIYVNRSIILMLITLTFAQYFWKPEGLLWMVDILVRGYLLFLCGVMGHEGSHSVLGNSKISNIWWSRLSFIPVGVPNVQFRITHRYHHSFTNVDEKDPDLLLKMDHWWQFPGRALAMPHHWMLWMSKNGLMSKSVIIEWLISYVVYAVLFGTVMYFVGWQRVIFSLVPAQILHSFILWYPFAIKTHEGHHLGPQEVRSHNYHGSFLYWLTLGLSLHRAHHMKPSFGWLQLAPFIKKGPLFSRDIILPLKQV